MTQKRNPRGRRQMRKFTKRIRFQVFYLVGAWVTITTLAVLLGRLFDWLF